MDMVEGKYLQERSVLHQVVVARGIGENPQKSQGRKLEEMGNPNLLLPVLLVLISNLPPRSTIYRYLKSEGSDWSKSWILKRMVQVLV